MAIYNEEQDPNTTEGVQIRFSEKEFRDFFERMVMMRFENVEEIVSHIWNGLGFKPDLEERLPEEDEEIYDNQLISNCTVNGEDLCYLDIYYLFDNAKQLYITEVGYDFST